MRARHLLRNLLLLLILLLSAVPGVTPAVAGDVAGGETGALGDPVDAAIGPSLTAVNWQITTIEEAGAIGSFTSLALDTLDRPHVSYYYGSPGNDLKYAYYVGTGGNCGPSNNWYCETVDSAGDVGQYTSLALDSGNTPHICYYDVTRAALKYATYVGIGGNCGPSNDWQCEVVDDDLVMVLGKYCSLALDTLGDPHISYYDQGNADLKYASYVGSGGNCGPSGNWQCDVVDSLGSVGQYTSLALDTGGVPRISYYSPAGTKLKYAFYVGTGGNCGPPPSSDTWRCEEVDPSGDVGQYTSLALDADGYPHISYIDNGHVSLKYAYYDGSHWISETVSFTGNPLGANSLLLDEDDSPQVAFFYGADRDLKYADYRDSTWIVETVDSAGDVGRDPSIALDSELRLHITYYDYSQGNLKYAYGCKPVQVVAISGPPTLEVGEVGVYTATYSPRNATRPVSLLWDNGSSNPTTTYSWEEPGVYTITVTATNPCLGGQAVGTYIVTVCQPLEEVTIDGPARLPVGEIGTYTAMALPVTATQPVTISWDNGTVSDTATYSWPTPGDYTIVVTANNSCSMVTGTLGVSVCQPVTGVTIEGPTVVLVGTPTAFTATVSPPTATQPVAYTWSNNTAIGPVAVYTWTAAGTYTLIVTATNDCGGAMVTATHVVTVTTCRGLDAVEVIGPDLVPVDTPTVYTATYSPVGASRPVTITWDNGTVSDTATYSWPTPGVYTINVTATNPCPSEVYGFLRVTVTACLSVSHVTVTGPAVLSINEPGVYTATYFPANANPPVTITWDIGTVGPTAVYSWSTPGLYTISVTATNPCGPVVTQTYPVSVTVCRPVDGVSVNGPTVLARGEVGIYAATYAPPQATLPVTITWDNGTIGPTAAYSWTTVGTHTIYVTATNPCSGEGVQRSYDVAVCQPVEGVTIDGPDRVTATIPAAFTATHSPGNATLPVNYTWNNGAAGSSAVYSWMAPGQYTVAVTASNVCGQMQASIGVAVFAQIYLPLITKNWNPCYIGPGGFWEDEPNDFRDHLNPDPDLRADGPICANRLYFGYPDDPNDYFFFYCGLETIDARVDGYAPGDGGQLLLYDGDAVIGWDPGCGDDCIVSGTTVDGGVCYIRIYTDPAFTTTVQPYTLRVNYQGP